MIRRLTLLAVAAAFLPGVCRAESQIAGDWQGTLSAGGAELRLVLHITAAKDGNLTATLDSIDQGANGIPVSAVTLKDSKLSLTLDAINGSYEGVVNQDATKIAGTWSQGQPLPLDFKRTPAQAASAAAPPAKPSLDGLDEFITQTMKDWKVPGLAIAVVQGDKVTLLKGYGYRDLEKQLPVTPNTLFAIGSITKSFTVTTLGMEMDEGKVDWDKPVRDYLPTFKLYEQTLTEQMTIRDLITHRSGLPRHDLVWYSSDFPREEILRRLQFLEPSKPLRSTFQYNNIMFMAAGYIAGQLNGSGWEDAVTQRIFKPLQMTGTNFSELETQNSADFGQPYRKGSDLKSELKRIPFDAQCPNRCAMGPAGEINSNVADMSKYLLFHMNHGKVAGKQLLSENNSVQMQTPQMVIPGAPPTKKLAKTVMEWDSFCLPTADTSRWSTAETSTDSAPTSRSSPLIRSASSFSPTSMAHRCRPSSPGTSSTVCWASTRFRGTSGCWPRKRVERTQSRKRRTKATPHAEREPILRTT